MNPSKFLLELKNRFSQQAWPWVFIGLRQDLLVWQALESTDLGSQALTMLPAQPEKWSPAELALLGLGNSVRLEDLTVSPLKPLEAALGARVKQAYDSWSKDKKDLADLTKVGLLALGLREYLCQDVPWQSVLAKAGAGGNGIKTVLACLYGMLPNPPDLLRALLKPAGGFFQPEMALHAMLSNPLAPEAQAEVLSAVLHELPLENGLAFLEVLSAQRPWMAASLAQDFLGGEMSAANPWSGIEAGVSDGRFADQFDRLNNALRLAQVFQFAAQPDRSVSIYAESLRMTRRLRGHLSAQLAQAVTQARKSSPDGGPETAQETGLEAWKQAVNLVPDEPLYSAGMAEAMIEAGRVTDAYAYLKGRVTAEKSPVHPAIALAFAISANRLGEVNEARQFAQQALEGVERGQFLDQDSCISLARFFLDANLPAEAARTAQAVLKKYPFNLDLLAVLGQAQSMLGQPGLAFSNVYAALAVERVAPQGESSNASASSLFPGKMDDGLRRLLVQSLEAAGEWQEALQERNALVASLKTPGLVDLQGLAKCALQAGELNQVIQACQQAAQLDPEDSITQQLWAEAAQSLDDYPTAVEHYSQVTRLTPQFAETWIALAKVHRLAGQDAQALNSLRAASQAIPDDPGIHFALGETYLNEGALTQALASLRRAASLSASSQIALRLGQTLLSLGHIEEARQVLQPAFAAAQTNGFSAAEKPHTGGSSVSAQSVSGQPASTQPAAVDPELTYAYAQSLLGLGELTQAISLLKDVIRAEPNNPEPCLEMGKALMQVGDQPAGAQRAIPFLKRILAEQKAADQESNAVDWRGHEKEKSKLQAEAQALLAEAYAKVGDLDQSMEAYRKALEFPLNREPGRRLSFGLGLVALKLDQPETAIAALQEAAQAEPLSAQVQRALSEAYLDSGLTQESFQSARAARDLNPTDAEMQTWFAEQGMRLLEQSGSSNLPVRSEVIQSLQASTQLAPSRGDLLVRLGRLHYENGNHPAALETFRRLATGEDVKGATSGELFEAAKLLGQMDEPALAIPLLQRAIDQNAAGVASEGRGAPVEPVDLYAELAAVHQKVGDNKAALKDLEQGISLDPLRKSLYLQKADLLVETRSPTEASDCLQRALRLDPEAADVHYRLAEVLSITGDLPGALTHVQNAITGVVDKREADFALPARLLAADLAYSMLQPKAARGFLGEFKPQSGSADDQLDYACMQAELALDAGDSYGAARAVAEARRVDPEHPRSMAVQARLANLQGDWEAGVHLMKSALEAYATMKPPIDELPLRCRRKRGRCAGGVCRGAADVGLYDDAYTGACRGHVNFPSDTQPLFLKGQILVEQAEWQNLCQALEMRAHAPGPDAISEQTAGDFQTAIEESQRQVDSIGVLESRTGPDIWGDEAQRALNLWRARGQAAFHPDIQNAQALEDVLRIGAHTPDDVAALLMVFIQIGDPARAVRSMQEEWIMYAGQVWVMTHYAFAFAKVAPQQGLDIAQKALTLLPKGGVVRCPQPPMLQYLVAKLANLSGQPKLAWRFIQEALATWSDEPLWHVLAAGISQSQEVSAVPQVALKALFHLEQAAHLEPQNAVYHQALGQAYQAGGDLPHAIQELGQACQLDPNQPRAWLALAQAQRSVGDLEQAAASSEKAIEYAPDWMDPLLLRAEIALQTNNPRGALSRIQTALRLKSDQPQALYLLARSLESLNRPAEALTVLDKAMPLYENPLPMQMERANLLRRSQGLDAGLAAVQQLASSYPQNPEILALQAEWLAEAGKDEEAIQAAQSALQVAGDQLPRQKLASLHFQVGVAMRRTGQLDQAIYHLNEAVGLMPGNMEAYLELGQAYQERREYKQALKVYQRAINGIGGDYRPYYQAGLVLKDSKDYLASEAMLRRAAQLAPNEVSIHRLLGAVVALNLVHNRSTTSKEVQEI